MLVAQTSKLVTLVETCAVSASADANFNSGSTQLVQPFVWAYRHYNSLATMRTLPMHLKKCILFSLKKLIKMKVVD